MEVMETDLKQKQSKELYLKVMIIKNLAQNSPIKIKYGLYAEQLSGTAFTMKRSENQKSWLYKVRPSVIEGQYSPSKREFKILPSYIDESKLSFHPNQLRWRPIRSV